MNSILTDTNILIYAFDESSEFHQKVDEQIMFTEY